MSNEQANLKDEKQGGHKGFFAQDARPDQLDVDLHRVDATTIKVATFDVVYMDHDHNVLGNAFRGIVITLYKQDRNLHSTFFYSTQSNGWVSDIAFPVAIQLLGADNALLGQLALGRAYIAKASNSDTVTSDDPALGQVWDSIAKIRVAPPAWTQRVVAG